MSSLFAPESASALTFAIEVVLKATIILAVAGLAVAAVRRSAAASRHFAWNVALISLLVLPALTFLPGLSLELPLAPAATLLSPLTEPQVSQGFAPAYNSSVGVGEPMLARGGFPGPFQKLCGWGDRHGNFS